MKKYYLELIVEKDGKIIRRSKKRAGSEKIANEVFHVEHDHLRNMQVKQDLKDIKRARKYGFYNVKLKHTIINEKTNGMKVLNHSEMEEFSFAKNQKFGKVDEFETHS